MLLPRSSAIFIGPADVVFRVIYNDFVKEKEEEVEENKKKRSAEKKFLSRRSSL